MRFHPLAPGLASLLALFVAGTSVAQTNDPASADLDRVRRIIVEARQAGAHGPGYNIDALARLGSLLSAADIPAILAVRRAESTTASGVRVGALFALASLCGEGIRAVRAGFSSGELEAVAADTLDVAAANPRCSADVHELAAATAANLRAELAGRREAAAQRAREATAADRQIDADGVLLLANPRRTDISHERRMAVFNRSVKAIGLDRPTRSPAEEDMVQRMYDALVLGKPAPPRPQ